MLGRWPDGSPGGLADIAAATAAVETLTRLQQDFPSPGVLFRDLSPVLADAAGLAAVIRGLAVAMPRDTFDVVAGLEARGFLLGAALAMHLRTGVLALRKPGKLPGAVFTEEYALEYGTAALQLNPLDVAPGARVLVVDDVLATGGTAAASVRLLRRAGAEVVCVAVVIELTALHGRRALPDVPVFALRQV